MKFNRFFVAVGILGFLGCGGTENIDQSSESGNHDRSEELGSRSDALTATANYTWTRSGDYVTFRNTSTAGYTAVYWDGGYTNCYPDSLWRYWTPVFTSRNTTSVTVKLPRRSCAYSVGLTVWYGGEYRYVKKKIY